MMSSHHGGELFTAMKRYGEITRPYASRISNITQFFMEILKI